MSNDWLIASSANILATKIEDYWREKKIPGVYVWAEPETHRYYRRNSRVIWVIRSNLVHVWNRKVGQHEVVVDKTKMPPSS